MLRTTSVIRLHTRNWFALLVLPLIIMSAAFAIILVVGIIANAVGGNLDGMYQGMQWNGAIWSGLGPLIGVGITAMLQFFPLSLGLGLTRKEFLAGTAVVIVGIAAGFAVLVAALKGIEQATHGWGLHVRMFDTVWVGTGSVWQTLLQAFLVLLTGMLVGTAFAATYQRFGQNAVWYAIGGLAVLGLVGFAIVLLVDGVGEWFLTTVPTLPWGTWMLLLACISLLAGTIWSLLVRKAPVR